MIRTFETHNIRKQSELTGTLWDFKALDGDHKDEIYQVLTPCWLLGISSWFNNSSRRANCKKLWL